MKHYDREGVEYDQMPYQTLSLFKKDEIIKIAFKIKGGYLT